MRHVINVVGSRAQLGKPLPRIVGDTSENRHETVWYACVDQENPVNLLDDTHGIVLRVLRGVVLGLRFYRFVQGAKLWGGRRPLIVVRGRSTASRVAAYAGTWGGGDVAMPAVTGEAPLGPTRFVVDTDGNLVLRTD
ncbi:MAG: hypothetical protein MJA32_06865 [Proteobacteria bacterium]|nr:hypothetical protein [Pseudomonadota bacterium]